MSIGVVAGLGYAVAWLPMFLFRAEDIHVALRQYEPDERFWVLLTPTLVTFHVVLGCNTMAFASPSAARLLLGAVVMTATLGFWLWGRSQIGPLRKTRLPDEPPIRLRRDGAFGIVRHPLYTSYLVASTVPLLVTPRWYLFVTLTPCIVAIATRARHEERRLRRQLGAEYDDYCRQVKQLIPFLW